MAKLQARTVGGTEDYVVTREFKAIATPEQRLDVMRACFAIGAASGMISAEETAVLNQIAGELDIDAAALNAIRGEYPRPPVGRPAAPADLPRRADRAVQALARWISTSPSPSRRRISASSSAS